MFTALVNTAEYEPDMNDEEIAAMADAVTSDLARTVDSVHKNNVLPAGCYFPCSTMKAGDTTVVFACNPLGSHWVPI